MIHSALLYCILDLGYTLEERAEETTVALLAGGANLLQLRAKGHDLDTIRRVAKKLIPLCRASGVPFILNDHPALAGEIGADGVHIGQDDGTLDDAKVAFDHGRRTREREIHSFIHSSSPIHDIPFPLIGRSTHSLAQARAALAEGFDYIGFGPLFPTPTKAGRPAIGTDDVATMQREIGDRIPAFCIGGIKRSNLTEVLETGARRVVIVSDLLTASDIRSATREAVDRLRQTE